MTLMGSHGDTASKPQLRQLTNCVRTALSEALQVCRASVHVTDMSVKGGDDSLIEMLQEPWRPNWHHQHHFFLEEAGGRKLARMMRRAENSFRRMNFTRVKASYEVRIFPEMRVSSKEIVQRIDRLQIFSRFADLNHLLVRSLVHRTAHAKTAEGVMLDDIGYGLREVKPRTGLPAVQLADCMEEGLLQDAREVHQYVIGLCCVLVLLITCAGSAIFSLKQPSVVPSRTNPLLALR
ncbi:RPS13 [Symbiodinium pilosum]|uniref:RPS13 protein n=1 Tax=Symbiodinium pilosum TaxID=2952 RepID=A0A812V3S5_SYMPI|nr:RPS13 [Symbiodinium pilosum]